MTFREEEIILPLEAGYRRAARSAARASLDRLVPTNTRQNNNIVWRNVNIVQFPWQLTGDRAALPAPGTEDEDPDDGVVDFIFRNLQPNDQTLYLEFVNRAERLDHTFLQCGLIDVVLPPELAEMWAAGGQEASGIERIDDLTFRVVKENAYIAVTVPAEAEYPIRMNIVDRVAPNPEVPPTGEDRSVVYHLDVIEHVTLKSMQDRTVDPVGGVTYEIHAAPIALSSSTK